MTHIWIQYNIFNKLQVIHLLLIMTICKLHHMISHLLLFLKFLSYFLKSVLFLEISIINISFYTFSIYYVHLFFTLDSKYTLVFAVISYLRNLIFLSESYYKATSKSFILLLIKNSEYIVAINLYKWPLKICYKPYYC